MDVLEMYSDYSEFSAIIHGMQMKLTEAIRKNPGGNFDEAHGKIEKLMDLRSKYHKVYQTALSLDNMNFRVTKNFHNMDEKIKQLEEEIKKYQKKENF